MKRLAEILAFVALAAAMHLALLTLRASEAGIASSGEGGEALMSLQASTASIEQMVEAWEKPPETPSPRTPPKLAQPQVETPDVPQQATPDAPLAPALPRIAGLALPRPETLPDAQATVPPPPPQPPEPLQDTPEPEAEQPEIADIRPQSRPERPRQQPRKTQTEQAPQKSRSSAASAAQVAAGQGGGQQAGLANSQSTATLSKGQRQSLVSQWGAQIRSRIERRKSYPRAARGASGSVKIRISVSSAGTLQGASIISSSGNAYIDEAALRAVRSAGRFPAAPRGLSKPVYSFAVPIAFNR